MPGTHHNDTGRQLPRTGRALTSFAAALALFLLGVAVTAACMGDDDDTKNGGNLDAVITVGTGSSSDQSRTPQPVMATFTPVPPNFTPEVVQTRSALQTAAALTATSQMTATPPPSVTINPAGPTGTVPARAINPPGASLLTSGGSAPSSLGSYNWYDLKINAGANVTAPYVILPESGASWAGGTQARLEISDSPYAVTGAEIKLFAFDGNVAIPTDQSGKPGDTPAFYPQTAPARQFVVQGQDILFSPEVAPGRYIVDMKVTWSTPNGLDQLWTQYIFLVDVV